MLNSWCRFLIRTNFFSLILFAFCGVGEVLFPIWYFQGKDVSANRIVVKINFLQIPNSVSDIDFCKFWDEIFRNGVSEKDMIFLKMYLLYTLPQKDQILFGGSDKKDSFQMHQFFLDIFDLLDEIDIIFVEFWLSVNYWDDAWSLRVQD